MTDFKAEALAFTREHSCPPSDIIELAMMRGAELAYREVAARIKREGLGMASERRNGRCDHGFKSGTIPQLEPESSK